MNLLTDPWIPVHRDGQFRQITYRQLLCGEGGWQVALSRDDLEMASLQLLIALTQCLCTPKTPQDWMERQSAPLSEADFNAATASHPHTFDLAHAQYPFMQTRGVEAKDVTPIQKLFVGLPEGKSSHALFNPVGEIKSACASCATIAIFNQATTAPSFGGGFKHSLRSAGGEKAPLSTLVMGGDLRQTIWRNVLHGESLDRAIPGWQQLDDRPVWQRLIAAGSTEFGATLGLMRGYFWQPAHLELLPPEPAQCCDCCGAEIEIGYTGFRKEKFNYAVDGLWPHPLSPRKWVTKKGGKEETFLSFTTTAPAWTQLSQFVLEAGDKAEGYAPAPVVRQFRETRVFHRQPLYMLVGGYRNKGGSVLERRHELFNLAAGWAEHTDDLSDFVNIGLAVKDTLRGSLFRFFKQTGIACHEAGQAIYYAQSERHMHAALREMGDNQYQVTRAALTHDLSQLARDIFEDQTAPYRHRPEIYRVIAEARGGLNAKLNTLQGGAHV